MNAKLTAKIKAVNAANAYAPKLYAMMADFFAPFVGQPILKNDGGILHRVEKTMPRLPFSTNLSVYRLASSYSLAWVVKTCENIEGEKSCIYHETVVYVGSLSGHTLTEITRPTIYRADYTPKEIEDKRNVFVLAKKAHDDALSNLNPFGFYDN